MTVELDGAWWQESRGYIFPDDTATPKLSGTQRTRLTGLGSASGLGM